MSNINYILYEDENPDEKTFDDLANLLHSYLYKFISEEALREDIRYCIKKGRTMAAYHEGELIGAVTGVYTPFFDKFHIAHLAVEEKFQGRGIGSELVERVVPEDTSPSVHLNTDNPGIGEFYKKLGFQATHIRYKRIRSKEQKPSD
ncbi:MAG: GNAT family N-acetyltransferase [Candidatus Saliniplasma sp.]